MADDASSNEMDAICALIGSDNSNPAHFVARSQLWYKQEKYVSAYNDAKAAYRMDPTSLEACTVLGKAAMKLQKFDEAYTSFKEGLAIDPKCKYIASALQELQKLILAEYQKKAETVTEYNPVTMCSQDIYPGDEEKYKEELDILAEKYKIVITSMTFNIDKAKKTEAVKIGLTANQCYLSGNNKDALYYCNAALDRDGTNVALRELRAEIHHENRDDLKALQDLWLIPKPLRTADVWKLGGRIFSSLELPVLAEFWLKKATNAVTGKDMESATLFQKVRVRRIYGPLTADFPVKVEFLEYGRAVVATDTLQPDDDAFTDSPVVIGQLMDCMHLPGCAHCGNSMIGPVDFFGAKVYGEMPDDLKNLVTNYWPDVSGVSCVKCGRERYCSAKCRNEAWDGYHQIICPSINDRAAALYDLIENKGHAYNEKGEWEEVWPGQYSPIILAKIWGMIMAEVKRLMLPSGGTEPSIEQWAKAKMPFRKFIAFGSESGVERMPSVYKMFRDIFKDVGDGLTYDVTESEFNARYFQVTCNLQAFSGSVTPKDTFIQNLSHLEDLRVLRMVKFLETKPPAVTFAGMFPVHACLNHACDNNVEVTNGFINGKPAVQVRVKQLIKPGEELFTTYIDTAMPRKLRRAWLYRSFNFWCHCRRCQFEGDDCSACTNCKKPAAEGKVFPGCGRCKKAWYCSTKCQKLAWVNGHKAICQMNHTQVHQNLGDKQLAA